MIRGKRLTDSIAMSGVVFMRAGSKWIAGLLPRGIATPVNTRDDEFERVAMAHWRSLLGVEKRIEPDNPLGEDLLQETLVWAWRGFDPFKAGTNGAWLFRIMFNVPYSIHAAGQPRARRGKPQPRIKSAARGPDRHKRCDGAARAFQKKLSQDQWGAVAHGRRAIYRARNGEDSLDPNRPGRVPNQSRATSLARKDHFRGVDIESLAIWGFRRRKGAR